MGDTHTQTAVLTTAGSGGGVKVGEERIKLIYTEERLLVHFSNTKAQSSVRMAHTDTERSRNTESDQFKHPSS